MANQINITVTATDNASASINKVGMNATAMMKTAASAAAGFAAAWAAANIGQMVTSFGADVVQSASSASESLNKLRVVFGESAAGVEEFAKNSAADFGLANRVTNEYLGTFGNLLTSMSLSRPLAADMSEGIVRLASDLASFNNIGVDEALEKIRAGLVGEAEPLRTVGVNLNQASIEAKAFEMGLIKQGETMSAATKAQASYALIVEQTKNAQGDFARTSDGLANQQRILASRVEDLKSKLGAALLPVVTDVVTKFNEWIDINGEDWANKFAGAVDAIGAAASRAADLLGALLDRLNKIDSFGRDANGGTHTMGQKGWGQLTTGRGFFTETARSMFGLPLIEAAKDFLDNNPYLNATRSGAWERAQGDRMANGGRNPLTGGIDTTPMIDDIGNFFQKVGIAAGGPEKISAAGGGGGVTNPLTSAWQRINEELRAKMVETWLKNGDEQRDIVASQNARMVEEVQSTAERIRQTLGVDMADAVTMAYSALKDQEQALVDARIDAAKKSTEAIIKMMEAESELAKKRAQEAFDLTKQLWGLGAGGGMTGAQAAGFAQLAEAASRGVTGSVDANGVFTPNGGGGNTTIINVNGQVIDSAGTLAGILNQGAAMNGPMLNSGVVGQ